MAQLFLFGVAKQFDNVDTINVNLTKCRTRSGSQPIIRMIKKRLKNVTGLEIMSATNGGAIGLEWIICMDLKMSLRLCRNVEVRSELVCSHKSCQPATFLIL